MKVLSLSCTTNGTQSAFWHLKNAMGSRNHSWAPADWLAHGLPLNFRCLRSCLCRDRWCLCRWMNTLLCALPFGLNISVSNVTNQMFVSRYVQPLCTLLGDLCIWIPCRCWRAATKYGQHIQLQTMIYSGNFLCICAFRHGSVSSYIACILHNRATVYYDVKQRLALLGCGARMGKVKCIFHAADEWRGSRWFFKMGIANTMQLSP